MVFIQITQLSTHFLYNNEIMCAVFIDLQRAFVTVNHESLLEKLNRYGIRSKENDCFRSFLTNRKQYVSVNGFFSQTKVARRGISQGSTLGPILFLIYINDLKNALDKYTGHYFADDDELKLLIDWLRANKLSLNESKTKLLIFRPSRKLNITVPNIKLNNYILNPEKTVTYLGIELDENFFWNKRI